MSRPAWSRKSGAWFSYDSVRIGQGRENSKRFLLENPEVMAKLENQIRGKEEEVAEEMMTGPVGKLRKAMKTPNRSIMQLGRIA